MDQINRKISNLIGDPDVNYHVPQYDRIRGRFKVCALNNAKKKNFYRSSS